MKHLVLLTIVLASSWALPRPERSPITTFKDINGRIIGGVTAEKGQFPWQVGIFVNSWVDSHFCGGSVISDQWILTAGHCVVELLEASIQLASNTLGDLDSDRVIVRAEDYILHENYSSPMFEFANDIGLIRLTEPLQFSDLIKPITLGDEFIGAGAEITVSGFGLTHDGQTAVSNELKYVSLTTISEEECSQVYNLENIAQWVCAKGETIQSTCNGDSGGPVIVDTESGPIQIGIVSFGSNQGCELGYPVGFTRVNYYREWIRSKTTV